ncbi:hypothetical protein [Streptomyces sp. NPDC101181]|uniref:hypothetical protein n=1 Tax=Streptomyces sp. NPDC101181 TaxID=3366125 RepID=UPI003819AC03
MRAALRGCREQAAHLTAADFVATVTMTAGTGTFRLGGVALPNRRLVLRWLRRQALRLADGHGQQVPADPAWLGARDVARVVFHGCAAPDELRAWAGDEGRQEEALSALEAGRPARLTVVDAAVDLRVTLAGWALGPGLLQPGDAVLAA